MNKKLCYSLLWLIWASGMGGVMAQQSFQVDSLPDLRIRTWVVKRADSFEQVIRVYEQLSDISKKGRPAAVFFFGGGWNSRNFEQFHEQSVHLARKGMVTIIADYRVKNVNGSSPLQSLYDARSAMRFVRSHASDWGVDSGRIAAGGGSAGGHLAAACYTADGLDDPQDDGSISPRPNLLLLFNPVIDNGPGGYGHERVKQWFPMFSPMHGIRKGFPPTIFFLGTQDHLIPVSTAEAFREKIKAVGGSCDVHLYEGAGHGFFNQLKYRADVWQKVDAFLADHGYVKP
jgi:acetyl esterase/lipase